MIVIYKLIATSVSSVPFEKVYEFIIFHSNALSRDHKEKSSMYLSMLFKLTCLYKYLLIVFLNTYEEYSDLWRSTLRSQACFCNWHSSATCLVTTPVVLSYNMSSEN